MYYGIDAFYYWYVVKKKWCSLLTRLTDAIKLVEVYHEHHPNTKSAKRVAAEGLKELGALKVFMQSISQSMLP